MYFIALMQSLKVLHVGDDINFGFEVKSWRSIEVSEDWSVVRNRTDIDRRSNGWESSISRYLDW